jgi:rubrerythrin
MIDLNRTALSSTRRQFFQRTSSIALSGAAIAMLGGHDVLAANSSGDAGKDVDILNVALALEHEAINAYTLGAQSGLLQKPVLDIALLFQSHHKQHRDALISTIQKLGGNPVMEKKLNEYAEALQANLIKSQADILTLAQRLEKGAANAYLSVIPAFKDSELAKISGRLAADETMHWTILSNALGTMLPQQALSFGA